MVRDDQIGAQLARPRRGARAPDAAIDGHDDPDALRVQALDGLRRSPYPSRSRSGMEMDHVTLQQLQGAAQHDGGADPVGVVVAVHGDPLPARDGAQEPLGGAVEVGEA